MPKGNGPKHDGSMRDGPLRGRWPRARRRSARTSPWRRVPQESWGSPRPTGTAPPRDRGVQRRGARIVLAALLPAALAGGSSAILLGESAPPPPAASAEREGSGQVGVTGHLPQDPAPGPKLLRDARDPVALATGAGPRVQMPDGPLGIPGPMLAAYREGARQVSSVEPSCGLHWSLLASIGRIESGHARSGSVDAEGTTVTAILGPRLDGGQNVAAIADTDDGRFDGDPVWDRAVGPMQFLPSTWQRYGVDGNGDGVVSPHNVHDSVVTAGRYLCAGDVSLDDEKDLVRAVFRYNHSQRYVREVLLWAAAYREGVRPVPVEVAPEDDDRDVLAGHRLSYRPLRLDPVPPGQPDARSDLAVPGRKPVTRTPGTSPPPSSPPPSSAPPSSAPPSSAPTGSPPSEPPSSAPPSSSTPPSEPPSSAPPSSTSPPSSSTNPPSSAPTGDEAGRTSTPPSTPPSGPPASGESSKEPVEPCDRALLDNGEFVAQEHRDQAASTIEPGTTSPSEADPGETVHVESDPAAPEGGELVACRVPSDYTAPR